MRSSPTARLAPLVLGLLWTALSGCASWPLSGKSSDTVPGITPPHQRIDALRTLAGEARSKDAAERERIASELAAEYPRETDPMIRVAMVRAIAACPGPASAAALREAAKDSDADVRIAVCKALGRQKGPEATAVLREMFAGDVDMDVRLAAARALGETRDPAAMATLALGLEDRDPAMQYRAVTSLRRIAPQDLGNDAGRWRQYLQGEPAAPTPTPTPSMAERLRRAF